MYQSPKASINLSAITHNLSLVKTLAPHSKVMAMVKADGYGHGSIEVASALVEADGLAVARLDEALLLRDSGIQQRLLLLSGCLTQEDLQLCARQHIDIVVHTVTAVDMLLSVELARPVNVWLKHNSGMHRLGLSTDDFRRGEKKLKTCSNVKELILMTHFSGSDESDHQSINQQISAFNEATAGLPEPKSLANSAAIIQHRGIQQDWVRPGIMLYGANPLPPELQQQYPLQLQPAMTLATGILVTRPLKQGQGVGYNHRWIAQRDSVIATAAIGYGDGYPRHARCGTPVLVNGQRAQLVGTVSMDLITIDITDCTQVNVGDEVILWGQALKAEQVATCADTISYELFTSISRRVARVYT